jgi:alpha-tubulin suppressor-like RCC1 family protein
VRALIATWAFAIGCVNPLQVFDGPDASSASLSAEQISAGRDDTCLLSSGALYCFGENTDGQLGVGDRSLRTRPTRVGTASDWISISCGESVTCGIRAGGRVWCWGGNGAGQVGIGSVEPANVLEPAEVIGIADSVAQVSAGFDHVCAVTTSGALYCWGENWEGGVGNGDAHGLPAPSRPVPTPVQIGAGRTYRAVAAGMQSGCAIASDGVYCWGRDINGALGVGSTDAIARQYSPVLVSNGSFDVVRRSLDVGAAIDEVGQLSLWGANDLGQMGQSTPGEYQNVPLPLAGHTLREVRVNAFGGCAISSDAALLCWGWLPPWPEHMRPTDVGGAHDWEQLALGRVHRCGIRAGGRVECIGDNNLGQLGRGHQDGGAELAPIAAP